MEAHPAGLHYKVWLERDGDIILGDGLNSLLGGVAREGSISRAASSMGLSYREAWGRVKSAEKRLGFRLLNKRVGGVAGGGTSLTTEAVWLLERYRRFRVEVDAAMKRIFTDNFGDSPVLLIPAPSAPATAAPGADPRAARPTPRTGRHGRASRKSGHRR